MRCARASHDDGGVKGGVADALDDDTLHTELAYLKQPRREVWAQRTSRRLLRNG